MPVIINGTTGISGVDGSAGTPAFQGSDANTGIRFGTDIVSLVTGGSDRLYIDSSGRLGIGSTAAPGKLTVATTSADPVASLSAWTDGYSLVSPGGTSTSGGIGFSFNTTTNIGHISCATPGTAWRDLIYQAITHRFMNGGSELVRIESSGRLLVGTSSAFDTANTGTNWLVGIENPSNYTAFSIKTNQASANGAYINLGKSRGTTANSKTLVNNNDELGGVYFEGADGSAMRLGANISAYVDGTPGASDLPTRLVFSTTADGASSPTERMRIANDGSISSVIPGGSTLYPRFGCRAWVNFNGTGTVAIRASGNVSSITDNGTGDYTVNFTTAMADANYAAVAGAGNGDDTTSFINGVAQAAPTTSAVRLKVVNSSTVASDRTYVHIAIFR